MTYRIEISINLKKIKNLTEIKIPYWKRLRNVN